MNEYEYCMTLQLNKLAENDEQGIVTEFMIDVRNFYGFNKT